MVKVLGIATDERKAFKKGRKKKGEKYKKSQIAKINAFIRRHCLVKPTLYHACVSHFSWVADYLKSSNETPTPIKNALILLTRHFSPKYLLTLS